MNILIINGSPRRNGNISRMLDSMREEALAVGAKVTYIYDTDLQVKPCTGCMACRKKSACVLPEDDAQRVLRDIEECNVLVIGAPCYWGNMPGQLKVLFDRMVYGMMGESPKGFPSPLHKGKKAVLVSTCTTPFPFNIFFNQSRGTVKALKEILRWSGFKVVAAIEEGGTRQRPVREKVLSRCKKIIRNLL